MFIPQLYLLLWKNFTIHKRRPLMTVLECFLPLLFAIVILGLKSSSQLIFKEKQVYPVVALNFSLQAPVIGFVPNCKAAKDVVDWIVDNANINNQSGMAKKARAMGFYTIEAAIHYFLHYSAAMNYIVEFEGFNEFTAELPWNITAIIHPYRKITQFWHTVDVFDFLYTVTPRLDQVDMEFLYFESLLSRGILHQWLKDAGKDLSTVDIPLYMKRFPGQSYYEDQMYLTLQYQLTLFIELGFLMSVFVFTKSIVLEKELKIKESMKLIGMNLTAYWTAWYITCLICLFPSMILYTLVLTFRVTDNGPVLRYSSASIIFLIIFCYGLALISFCFMVSCLVQKANDGAIAAGLIFLSEYVPYEIISQKYQSISKYSKIPACLLFNVAMGFGMFNVVRREARVEGVQWHNIADPIDSDDFTIAESIIMLLTDTAIHLLLTWYLDSVFPGDFGVPKPFYFFLTKRYWCPDRIPIPDVDQADIDSELNSLHFEKDPEGLNVGISIRNLQKEYYSKIVVNGLNLNIYEGQITVLLGHNGAGKTTTMSMLTGFIPPTEGTAIINGYDIRVNIAGVRKSLGLCPQYNILFDALTVKEHLWFFAHMKGYRSRKTLREIREMIKDIDLESRTDFLVCKLSGGQKRSLSVGIALIGGSKVVFLDEPSSGMDPSTRRRTWDVLQKHRKGRTLLLSTHYMDEADALGDRIIIMSAGMAKCCGTSLFLKKLYGAGYHLVVVKAPGCDVQKLTQVVVSHIQHAYVEYIVSTEIQYLLPDTECEKFPDLFRYLNSHKRSLRIESFGTTATTMEEVFLKSERDQGRASRRLSDVPDPSISGSYTIPAQDKDCNVLAFNSGFQCKTGTRLWMAQFRALLLKRYIVAKRHIILTVLSYLLPGIFIMMFIIINTSIVTPTDKEQPLLIFDINLFGSSEVPIYFDASTAGIASIYMKQFHHEHQGFRDMSDLEVHHYDEFLLKIIEQIGQVSFDHIYIVGAEFSKDVFTPTGFGATMLYNGQPHHADYVSLNLLMNAVAMHALDARHNMTFGVSPLPKAGEAELKYEILESYRSGFFMGMFAGIGFGMYSSLVVYYLLRERQSGVKHMHAIFGVSMVMYWLPTLLWDAMSFIVPTIILFIIFGLTDENAFLSGTNSILTIVVIIMFVWAILPCTYAVHFLFATPASGLAGIVIFNLFSVLLADIMVFELLKPDSENSRLGQVFDWLFTAFFPTFNLSQSLNFIRRNYKIKEVCQPMQNDCNKGVPSLCCVHHPDLCHSLVQGSKCFQWAESYLAMDKEEGIGINIMFMFIQGIIGCFVVVMVEYGVIERFYFCYCKKDMSQMDDDESDDEQPVEDEVQREKDRVTNTKIENLFKTDSLVLMELQKKYHNVTAVDNITVGVPEKECFGLLGQSGAGKTTLFRMLTGETGITSGSAYLKGYEVRTDLKTVQSNIGYCPQFDAHIEELTARETLSIYANLRGIPNTDVEFVVRSLIDMVLLRDYTDIECGTYSGGNKRKLSLAMALIGDPPFIFLDEPSSGMDPKARRQMWDVLSQIRACGRTLVLSSHSMEECDALCTRLAIMLRGRFMCLGSPQHLKNKYGQGYTLIIKMGTLPNGDAAPTETVVAFLQSVIPQTSVFDDHQGYLHLQISDNTVEVADVFFVMEENKKELNIEDYSVHETTLEQIFLTFTKMQGLDDDDIEESCWFLRAGFFADNIC